MEVKKMDFKKGYELERLVAKLRIRGMYEDADKWLVKIKIHESPRLMVLVSYAWVIFVWLAIMIFLILAIANS